MATEYSVDQVLAMEEVDLVEYMKNNRDARGTFDILNIQD
jgi:hypothetical protein